MKYRIPLFATALLLIGVFAGPLAAAQNKPPKITININFDHDQMGLPPEGKANMPIQVTVHSEGFACAGTGSSGATISFSISDVSNFPKYYGASVEPKGGSVLLNQGEPGLTGTVDRKPSKEIVLNLAWDLENIPKKNAFWPYVLQANQAKIDGTCQPSPTFDTPKSPPMNASMPDQVVATSASGATPICTDAFQQGCIKPSNTAPAQSPGFDIALMSVGIVGVLAVFGRRK